MNITNKGDYGYLTRYKRNKLIATVVLGLMIILSVVITVIMFGDTKRVAIIFAILLSLPFAKFFIAYITCARYKSIDAGLAEIIYEKAGRNSVLLDMVISQYEGMKHYSSICVKNGGIYALITEKDFVGSNQSNSVIYKEYESWITNCACDSKYNYKVRLFSKPEEYIKKLSSISEPNDNNKLIDKHIRERICDSSI